MPKYAEENRVDREGLDAFLGRAHRAVLITHRQSGGLQSSPVTCGIDTEGRVLVSTYPQRAKVANIRRNSAVSLCVMEEAWNGEYVHLDGSAEVLDLPDALEPLVEYFRSISGEHPDWDEYREAMAKQGKCLIRIVIEQWGPVSSGGFPPPSEG